ncbi:major facilitator superfamily domain-containing protein [Roridomyces roridus]|uniref:Major facilitator superfamily domain-containing protein n=1 Tax=Roridomyces roridus TaxID=1738132 RepID=A0AAD7FDL8_9AGAR|nr:major facilitator superfamily domain-containing protein [Roridomyces roridus]
MRITTADAFDDSQLTAVDRANTSRWRLTWPELKLLFIASTGFFIDAYDIFNINLVVVVLNILINGKLSGTILNASLQGGVLKAAVNIGCVIGQIGFGLAGDILGRHTIYGFEMIVTTVATILVISGPISLGKNLFTYITVFRVLMGIGIGGDYPMSASVVADRANLRRRGTMVTFIFAMQGWGSFIGAIVFIILMAIYKKGIEHHHHISQLNSLWRIYTGVIIIPGIITIVQRLLMTESARMRGVQAIRGDPSLLTRGGAKVMGVREAELSQKHEENEKHIEKHGEGDSERDSAEVEAPTTGGAVASTAAARAAAWRDAREYFSEWRHLKILIGTTMSWFLLDIIFYGISLNQSIFITALGLASSKDPWEFLWQQGVANVIIAIGGFLPGYYFTLFTIEYLGRKKIQIMGLTMNAIIFAILAGKYTALKANSSGLIACFIFLQFFFNFGANATTFVVPAEVFPTRVRGFGHGVSAASGKCGAIIASLAVSIMATNVGPQNVLWLFFGIAVIAIPFTFLIPETKDRDADLIDLEERREKALWQAGQGF